MAKKQDSEIIVKFHQAAKEHAKKHFSFHSNPRDQQAESFLMGCLYALHEIKKLNL